MKDNLLVKGCFYFKIIRDGECIHEAKVQNEITIEGRNKLLDIGFHGAAQVSWYIGLMTDFHFSNNTDTMASHSGWIENINYAGTRPEWTPLSFIGDGELANETEIDFIIDANTSLGGFFISSVSTKGSSSGVLWNTAVFNTSFVKIGDQIRVKYTIGRG